MSDLKRYWENIYKECKTWYNLAMTIAQSVDVKPSVPWLAKGCSRFRSNVQNDRPKSYYKWAVVVPFLNEINSQLQDGLQDRNHIDIYALLSSVMPSNNYNIDETAELFFQGYKNEMLNQGVHFSCLAGYLSVTESISA